MMIKVSDYIANYLAEAGLTQIFMLTGGGAMHLNNSLGKHPKLHVIFTHHEQACAMAAESYTRLSNNMAVVNVTTGPGGLNALNGVFGAWTDSIPMLILSGQVRYDTTIHSSGLDLRQLGDQECDIIRCVKPITKLAEMVIEACQIKYYLQKAIYLATHGRPGPVWLDIPMNIQNALIDETQLIGFDETQFYPQTPFISEQVIADVLQKIQQAQRPLILAGSGVRLSGSHDLFLQLISALNIPVTTAWNAHDILSNDHPLYIGRPGSVGDRAGNFAVQNSDLLIILGCRLNIRQISYNWKTFARAAFKIMVDIDPLELIKPTINIHLPIHGHLKDFFQKTLTAIPQQVFSHQETWLTWCRERKKRYPVVQENYWKQSKLINPYCFMQKLSQLLPEGQITVTGNGTACVAAFQAMQIKKNQRLYTNSGCASMGYDLPAAIGACFAAKGQAIICIAGDGSIQQNIQELAVIAHHQLPIKIFVLNNNGYHSIRQTQANFFGEPYVGVGPESGFSLPSFEKIAYAYGLDYTHCSHHDALDDCIKHMLNTPGPILGEILLTPDQPFAPKCSSKQLANGRIVSRPLEDLAPFLSPEELAENMLIELLPES